LASDGDGWIFLGFLENSFIFIGVGWC
jgi:hypothetical protein